MSRTVSLLGRFGSSSDPETSNDPRIRALVAELSTLEYAPAARPEFRDELRAQLVAITERVVAEGDAAGTVPASIDPAEARHALGTATVTTLAPAAARRRRSIGRPLGLAAACCAVLALGLGGAVWKSRSALPGDSLYGLKRASESVQLSLASGDSARGHEYLRLASTRVHEARDLIGHTSAMASGGGVQAGGLSPSTVALIQQTLRSANGDVTSGSALLGTEAVQSHSAAPLTIMTTWAPTQLHQLSQLATALGTGPAHASTLTSWTLVNSALHRARTLEPKVGSQCIAARHDALGPLGCTGITSHGSFTPPPRHASPRPSTTQSPHANTHVATSGSTAPTAPTGTGTGTHSTRKQPTTSGSSSGPTTRPAPKLPVTLPPSLPISVGSCGVSAQVGPFGVHLGSCPTR